jgi:hypothetical protein
MRGDGWYFDNTVAISARASVTFVVETMSNFILARFTRMH